MSAALALSFSAAEQITVGLMVLLAVVVGLIGYRTWQNSRIPAEELERQRRAALVATGKMGDATLTEVHDDVLVYAYVVRGVEYTATQDVSHLRERVPSDLAALTAVLVRYDARNPANSIVVAEDWSGLHSSETKRQWR
ncbi:MAG TPA: hypothetical protein VKX45_16720 [Bryobacteraceae bacterium]|jgi:tartrate dehydratase beta subunit/fumarate hydratase class I family protein|nr:hypothetical protein [Bryobacteraceae bacterium]